MVQTQQEPPRRILLVHTHYRLPGGEDAVFAAERALLEARGHQVFVYERSNAEADGSLWQKLLLPLRAVFSLKAYREVRALIRKYQIQLVHVHNTLLATSPAVFWACFAEGVPVVQTLHNFRLFCPNGVFLRQGKVCEDCPRRSLLCAVRRRCYRGSLTQSAVCAFVYGFHRLLGTYKNVALFTPTEFDRQKLLECNARHRVFDPEKLFVKPNPVSAPLPAGQDAPLPMAARKNQVLYAGRLEELKGLRTVLAAWKLLESDPAAPRLVVAGDGPLDAWARENAGPNVEFVGRLAPGALHAEMARSLAVAAASLCYESFALGPAEAHVLGTPVLASDIGNVGAAVTPGVDGARVSPRRPGCAGRRGARAVRQAGTVRPRRHPRRGAGPLRRHPRRRLCPADGGVPAGAGGRVDGRTGAAARRRNAQSAANLPGPVKSSAPAKTLHDPAGYWHGKAAMHPSVITNAMPPPLAGEALQTTAAQKPPL